MFYEFQHDIGRYSSRTIWLINKRFSMQQKYNNFRTVVMRLLSTCEACNYSNLTATMISIKECLRVGVVTQDMIQEKEEVNTSLVRAKAISKELLATLISVILTPQPSRYFDPKAAAVAYWKLSNVYSLRYPFYRFLKIGRC